MATHLCCVGTNSFGQLGLPGSLDGEKSKPVLHPVVPATFLDSSGTETPAQIQSVHCGRLHTALVTTDGRLLTTGQGAHGQLGHGACENLRQYRWVEALGNNVATVACGHFHTLVLCKDGSLFAMGMGDKGRLGTGSGDRSAVPVKVELPAGEKVKLSVLQEGKGTPIAAGGGHSVILTESSVLTFGEGKNGQLGHGNTDDALTPTPVKSLDSLLKGNGVKDAFSVVAGENHTCIVAPEALALWGMGTQGQLGGSAAKSSPAPQRVMMPGWKWISVSLGNAHSIALIHKAEEPNTIRLVTWGANQHGQAGILDKKETKRDQPNLTYLWQGALMKPDVKVASLQAGHLHCLATARDHKSGASSVFSWGRGTHGQLGTGRTEAFAPEPAMLEALNGKDVLSLGAGEWHSVIAFSQSGSGSGVPVEVFPPPVKPGAAGAPAGGAADPWAVKRGVGTADRLSTRPGSTGVGGMPSLKPAAKPALPAAKAAAPPPPPAPLPVCPGCQKDIEGKGVSGLGSKWHPECFVCKHCGKGFEAGFVKLGDFAYHSECAKEIKKAENAAEKEAARARAAKAKEEDDARRAEADAARAQQAAEAEMARQAQAERLREEQEKKAAEAAAMANAPTAGTSGLGGSANKSAGSESPHAPAPAPAATPAPAPAAPAAPAAAPASGSGGTLCSKCGVAIVGQPILTAMAKKWHKSCFTCGGCNKPFDGPFSKWEDQPYHKECALAARKAAK